MSASEDFDNLDSPIVKAEEEPEASFLWAETFLRSRYRAPHPTSTASPALSLHSQFRPLSRGASDVASGSQACESDTRSDDYSRDHRDHSGAPTRSHQASPSSSSLSSAPSPVVALGGTQHLPSFQDFLHQTADRHLAAQVRPSSHPLEGARPRSLSDIMRPSLSWYRSQSATGQRTRLEHASLSGYTGEQQPAVSDCATPLLERSVVSRPRRSTIGSPPTRQMPVAVAVQRPATPPPATDKKKRPRVSDGTTTGERPAPFQPVTPPRIVGASGRQRSATDAGIQANVPLVSALQPADGMHGARARASSSAAVLFARPVHGPDDRSEVARPTVLHRAPVAAATATARAPVMPSIPRSTASESTPIGRSTLDNAATSHTGVFQLPAGHRRTASESETAPQRGTTRSDSAHARIDSGSSTSALRSARDRPPSARDFTPLAFRARALSTLQDGGPPPSVALARSDRARATSSEHPDFIRHGVANPAQVAARAFFAPLRPITNPRSDAVVSRDWSARASAARAGETSPPAPSQLAETSRSGAPPAVARSASSSSQGQAGAPIIPSVPLFQPQPIRFSPLIPLQQDGHSASPPRPEPTSGASSAPAPVIHEDEGAPPQSTTPTFSLRQQRGAPQGTSAAVNPFALRVVVPADSGIRPLPLRLPTAMTVAGSGSTSASVPSSSCGSGGGASGRITAAAPGPPTAPGPAVVVRRPHAAAPRSRAAASRLRTAAPGPLATAPGPPTADAGPRAAAPGPQAVVPSSPPVLHRCEWEGCGMLVTWTGPCVSAHLKEKHGIPPKAKDTASREDEHDIPPKPKDKWDWICRWEWNGCLKHNVGAYPNEDPNDYRQHFPVGAPDAAQSHLVNHHKPRWYVTCRRCHLKVYTRDWAEHEDICERFRCPYCGREISSEGARHFHQLVCERARMRMQVVGAQESLREARKKPKQPKKKAPSKK